jgi:hypothetical protein
MKLNGTKANCADWNGASMVKYGLAGGFLLLAIGCGGGETGASVAQAQASATTGSGASTATTASNTTGAGGAGGMAGVGGNGGMPAGVGGSGGDLGAYPSGPYGNQQGDTMALLTWEGHHNPAADQLASNTTYLGSFTTQDLRQSSKPYALIHTAAVF